MFVDYPGPMWTRAVLHLDLDAFYASVEQRDRPELRGRPVVVVMGDMERGAVATASYEARAFGVRSAMPVAQARLLCPEGVYVPVDRARYLEASEAVMALVGAEAQRLERVSIDEAYLEPPPCKVGNDDPVAVARRLREAIRDEVGLTASVGVAPNKLLAKLASAFQKPDGLTVVEPGEGPAFLEALPVSRIPGVGPRRAARLEALGHTTVGALARAPLETLVHAFGEAVGVQLHGFAQAFDPRPVRESARTSLSFETTLARPTPAARLTAEVSDFAGRCAAALEARGLGARTVVLKYRPVAEDGAPTPGRTRSRSLSSPTARPHTLEGQGLGLLAELGDLRLRLVGLGVSNLAPDVQPSLF